MRFCLASMALMLFTETSVSQPDSSKIRQLECDIQLAEVALASTSFWSRITPTIDISASFGMKDALIYDPASSMLLPRDSYRLTIGLPLHELFHTEKHEEAAIRLRRLHDELVSTRKEYAIEQERQKAQNARAANDLRVLNAELHLLREIVRYNEILFNEGKAQFDALARARLQALQTERQILHLQTDPERKN